MARYHLYKQTRIYEGQPYAGYSMEFVRPLRDEAASDDLEEAKHMAEALEQVNPVGWNIWDSTTGKLVSGHDMFKE